VAREPTAADQLPVIGSEPSRIHIIFGRWESRLAVDTSNLTAVDVCDLLPEALFVLRRFVQTDEVPPCYEEALEFLGCKQAQLERNRALLWEYHAFDCLIPWTHPSLSSAYDLLTAIGCFGLAPSKSGYATAFSAAAEHLDQNGRFIGVDWVRSCKFIEEERHDNSYLDATFITRCAAQNDLKQLLVEEVYIKDDPYYSRLVIWAFECSN